jgi:hypothetical protein
VLGKGNEKKEKKRKRKGKRNRICSPTWLLEPPPILQVPKGKRKKNKERKKGRKQKKVDEGLSSLSSKISSRYPLLFF